MISERHELLELYLADLERRLDGAEPVERADVLASVREHVEADLAALGRPATSADVAASLAALGSVESVMAPWSPEGTVAAGVAAGPIRSRRTSGLVVTTSVFTILGIALLPFAVFAGIAALPTLALAIVSLRRREEPRWVAFAAIAIGGVCLMAGLLVLAPALSLAVAM